MVTLSLRASGMKNRAAQNKCFGRMSFIGRCLTLTNGIRSLTAAAQKRQFAGCYLMKKTSSQSASWQELRQALFATMRALSSKACIGRKSVPAIRKTLSPSFLKLPKEKTNAY